MEMVINNDKNTSTDLHNRYGSRVSYGIEIFYPIINNVSVYKNYDISYPLMIAVNISESGICFNSRVHVRAGDFISFMLQIGENPSFWCLSEVKWAEEHETHQYVGCRFYMLNDSCVDIIRKYVETTLK